ncbi:MAG TPA: GTP-binding protein, partial [Beijerinckiaceae bacterium]
LESAAADAPASAVVAALRAAPRRAQAHAHPHGDGPGHEHDHSHAHAHAPHEGGVSAHFLPLPEPVPPQRLADALAAVDAAFGDALLRCKGALPVPGGGVEIVQAEPGRPVERTPHAPRPGAEPLRLGLTLIARHAPAQAIADYLAARLARETPGAAA